MNTLGNKLRVTLFGQSHAPFVGVSIEGLPVGMRVDEKAVTAFLSRRKSTGTGAQTPRTEADEPRVLCGIREGTVCGDTVTVIFENTSADSSTYDTALPRPGHADFAALMKYGKDFDLRGGGPFSGRLTLPLCYAGALALQILNEKGVTVESRILSVAGETDESRFDEVMMSAREACDSVGGRILLTVYGVPAGLGDPPFGGMENRLSTALFAIPAVKEIAFGDTKDFGSENNDPYGIRDGKAVPLTNHAGGILGGITTGADLAVTLRVKPVPSIAKPQQTVNMELMREETLAVRGRHDACILPRALPCAEAAVALVICDMLMGG